MTIQLSGRPALGALALTGFMTTPLAVDAMTLTLLYSNAQVQVAQTGAARDDIVITDSTRASLNEPQLGGFSTADTLTGAMSLATNTAGRDGTLGTTNSTSLQYRFRYNGATPLVIEAGALTYAVDASLLRELDLPSLEPVNGSVQSNFNATFVGLNGLAGATGNARIDVVETTQSLLRLNPISNNFRMDLDFTQQDEDGLSAVFSNAETTLLDGALLDFIVTMSGSAIQVGASGALQGIDASVDATDGGQLGLVLPDGVAVEGLNPGQTLSWVSTGAVPPVDPPAEPSLIPLPASAPLLLMGLGWIFAFRINKVKAVS